MYEGLYEQYAPTTPFGPVTLHARLRINDAEFEVGKEEYTLSFNIQFNGLSKTFTYKYRTTNDGLPAICIHGQTIDNNVCIYPKFFYQIETHFDIVKSSNAILNSMTATGDNIGTFQADSNTVWGYTPDSVEDKTLNITIDADFPIFSEGFSHAYSDEFDRTATEIGLRALSTNYLPDVASGDYDNLDKSINYFDIANTIPNDKVWDIIDYLKVNGTITTTKAYCFRILPTAKIAFYVDDRVTGDTTPNMHLVISEFPCDVKNFYAPDSSYTEVNSVDTDYWWGHWTDTGNNSDIIGYGATNIPIFHNLTDVNKYFNGDLGIEDSINGGDASIQTSTIGALLNDTEIPSISLATSGVGCFAYALSEADIKDIMGNYLFTDNQTLITTMQDALWTWGNNPIDFMIDCYYVPFAITDFYTTTTANLKFGNYQFPGTSFSAITETSGNRLTLFNTTFEGTYNDWRDYTQFSYDLFLPFIGFVPIDPQKYINRSVKCEMMFDITTHNLRYYLFCDGIITDRFDGSVGVNIPLMATDIVNKAKHDRDIKYGLATGALNTAGSLASSLTSPDPSKAMGGITSSVGNIIGMVKQYQELGAKASSNVEGSFSSAMNIYDISYAYLRITEEQIIIPAKTTQLYNHPSYYMGAVSSLSGYCELADIRFSSTATEPEIQEIQSLLRSGVIF